MSLYSLVPDDSNPRHYYIYYKGGRQSETSLSEDALAGEIAALRKTIAYELADELEKQLDEFRQKISFSDGFGPK